MSDLLLVTFAGCPHAASAREVLQHSGRDFREVVQDTLPEGDPLRGYTSPSILLDGRLLFGAASGESGCSIAPLDAEQLLAELRTSASP